MPVIYCHVGVDLHHLPSTLVLSTLSYLSYPFSLCRIRPWTPNSLPTHLFNMANLAKLPLTSSLSNLSCLLPCPFPSTSQHNRYLYLRRSQLCKIHARLGGGTDGESTPGQKKKFITKEEEPDQYWQTAGEREGENPMKTPLPYIIIFGMSTPFVILAIAFANGWIKVPVR